MVYILDILDMGELDRMLDEGRIDVKDHPELPLQIFNYTAKAQYTNEWTESEQHCRGLIVHRDTGEIIARGPKKFFNVGQAGAPEIALDARVRVTTKEDGSLGVPWYFDGHYGVATRGSFISEQAIKATEMMDDDLKAVVFAMERISTPAVEIIFPSNRIVIDYGSEESLRTLGMVCLDDGLMDRAAPVMTFAEALELPIGENAEGFVIDVLNEQGYSTAHAKLKGDWYVRMHKIMTNTSARQVWIELAARSLKGRVEGKNWAKLGGDPADFERVDTSVSLEDFIGDVPDEFRIWVDKTVDDILKIVSDHLVHTHVVARSVLGLEPKAQFEVAKDSPMAKEIMAVLREHPKADDMILTKAWALAKPAHELPFSTGFDN